MEHLNHMNGISFIPKNPMVGLEMVLYSSFLKEPSFYNPATDKDVRGLDSRQTLKSIRDNLRDYFLFPNLMFENAQDGTRKSRQKIFYEICMRTLDHNFKETLELAVKARKEYHMRNSPCQLIAIAASHPKRGEFNKKNPLFFRNIVRQVCMIPPDMISILDSWKSLKGSKSKFPSFLKKVFADIVMNLTPYHVNKYRRACIDIIRLSHPSKTSIIEELIKQGRINLKEEDMTWEILRSKGKTWEETVDILNYNMPHMASLRNLRNVALQVRKEDFIQKYCQMLEKGVPYGKQFPFQYLTAYESIINLKQEIVKNNKKYYKKALRKTDVDIIKKCLENCIQKSIENHPKLNGNVIILSDNSGSATNMLTSSFGTRTIADIGNLSALITALSCTGKAVIGLFGDNLIEYEVDKNLSFLENYDKIQKLLGTRGKNVGLQTENGIWLFFKRAMQNPEKYHYDHFFCYSDQQAGHGGLYGCDPEIIKHWSWDCTMYVHVPKLIEHYRNTINPKINVFTVQTAGYNDSILPDTMKRCSILYGWTGKEVVYAEKMIRFFDEQDL